ncbi:MAG: ornithine cyclodeaminase family protein [Actinomycetota bacterium]|nr:ornithine cyclodeaminase family protein [Actinomycetota bacterium]
MPPPIVLDAGAVRARCTPDVAVDALEAALRAGLDPSTDTPRIPVGLEHGQFLLMPSQTGGADAGHVGAKIVTVAPDNPAVGLPRIQASYLLFDRTTLSLRAILDGIALTNLRTPAVSIAAARSVLAARTGPLRMVVVGAGPQAIGHVATVRAALAERPLADLCHLVRDPTRVPDGLDPDAEVVRLGTDGAADRLRTAELVVCATSAREPLFDSDLLGDRAVVVAMGSHEPDAREVDARLCARATVIVEDVAAAQREAGDVVMAIDEGALAASDLVTMRDAVDGSATIDADRPVFFKGVGMSWEDLVVAEAVMAGGEA